jgi:hypothetical protein
LKNQPSVAAATEDYTDKRNDENRRKNPLRETMDIPLQLRQNPPGEIARQRNNCPREAEQVSTRQAIAQR